MHSLRTLFRQRRGFFSMSNRTNSIGMRDSEMSSMMATDFKEAIELANKEHFESSAVYFQKMVKQMEGQQVSPKVLEIVYKKYSVVLKQLGRQSQLVGVLQQLYFVVESQAKSASAQATPVLQNLLRETLLLDPARALMFSDYLWEAQANKTSLTAFKKSIYPYLGMVYVMNGHLDRGISLWEDSLAVVTNVPMKGLLLNNLAITKYQVLLDKIQALQRGDGSKRAEKWALESEFQQGREEWLLNLKSALEQFESKDPARQEDLVERHQYV